MKIHNMARHRWPAFRQLQANDTDGRFVTGPGCLWIAEYAYNCKKQKTKTQDDAPRAKSHIHIPTRVKKSLEPAMEHASRGTP